VDAYRCDHNGHLDKCVHRGMAIEIGLTIFSHHVSGDYNPSHKCLEPRSLILTVSLLWFNFRIAREQRGSVELVRSANECMGDLESTEEAFCCPDFRVRT
jgi:hypothetical protein